MNLNNNKETPDYGEPWKLENTETETWVSATNWTRDPGDIACEMGDDNPLSLKHWPARAGRIVQCVNACVGMADPAAELAAMREAIKEAEVAINSVMDIMQNNQGVVGWHLNGEIASWDELDLHSVTQFALAKLQPFIK